MTEDDARRIAEEELRRINALLDLDVRIDGVARMRGLWLFTTAGRGSESDRPKHLCGIAVHDSGRVNTALTFARPDEQLVKFRASLANPGDLRWLIQRSKYDFDRVDALAAHGYPAVAPILDEVLAWLRDGNWPIAHKLSAFIAGIGAPLAPHVRKILAGDDRALQYWLLGNVIGSNAGLFALFKDELNRLATNPTPEERHEELDERARGILEDPPSAA